MIDTPSPVFKTGDRNIALVNYGLLFSAVFFVGVPALIAVVIAYALRDQAARPVRSHYDFQIRIFWISFVLNAIAAALLIVGVVMSIGELAGVNMSADVDAGSVWIDLTRLGHSQQLIGAFLLGGAMLAASCIWMLAAPAFGFIRLASERRIGEQAA